MKITAGIVSLFVLLILMPLRAHADDDHTVKEQIEALERRLTQQAAEIERLRAEQQRLLDRLNSQTSPAASPSAVTAAPAPVVEPASVGMAQGGAAPWPSTPGRRAGDRPNPLKVGSVVFGGYGSFRFEANNVGGTGNQIIPGGSAKSFTFRRFVTTADATFNERLKFHSELEFERLLEFEVEKKAIRRAGGVNFSQGLEGNNGAEVGLEQLWLQYDLGHQQAIRAGVILPPLGRFNINHDDDYWDIPRRTLVDRDGPVIPVKAAWRELGAGLVGALDISASGKLNYQVYVTNGSTLDFNLEHKINTRANDTTENEVEAELRLASGAVDGSKNAGAVAWRLAYSPSLAGEIGLSGYHAKYTPFWLPIDKRVNAFAIDGKWRFRGFELEGEGVWTGFEGLQQVAQTFAQTVLQSKSEGEVGALEGEAEVELAGLARQRYGFWTDLKYHWRPAFLKNSFLGRGFEDPQLIPIVRYERIWLRKNLEQVTFTDGAITALGLSNREQDRLTLGVNYRPTAQVGLQLAYEHNQRRSGSGLVFPQVLRNATDGFLMGLTFSF